MRAAFALAAVIVVLGAGCATTKQQATQPSPAVCGFVGADLCRELQPGGKDEAACAT